MMHNPPLSEASQDEHELVAMMAAANVPTLLMVIVQLTGELRWLDDPYRPTRTQGMSENETGGLPEAIQQEIRDRAVQAVRDFRLGTPIAIPHPDDELLLHMMSVTMGEEVPAEYAPMIAQDLGIVDTPDLSLAAAATEQDLSVLIIGSGVSGLCAGVLLKKAGIPFRILERRDNVGGTWWDNRYPGCGVDTPSHLYTFSFAPYDWPYYFSPREDLHRYMRHIADTFDLWPHISLNTNVERADFDEDAQKWHLEIRGADGEHGTLDARILISAVGALNQPKVPHLHGADRFTGPATHTARWPSDFDVTGKRVGVVGTGASAMQLVPAIVDTAERVTVFQRSPQWAGPYERYKVQIPEAAKILFREVPLYEEWYRQRLAWCYNDRIHMSLQKDPDWEFPDRSVNAINDAHRRYFTRHIVEELGDRQDLLDQVLPDYPPFGKRILFDHHWFRKLAADEFRLVTEPIETVEEDGIRTADGELHDLDVLVYATGFDATRFMSSFDLRGRNGKLLRDEWNDDDCRAYLGMTIAGFPNFFCLYGPNLQVGHGGSIIFLTECEVRYLVDGIQKMLAEDLGVVEVRRDVYDEYNRRVDEAHAKMVWTHPGMSTYYRNSRGRIVVNNPFRVVEYWHNTIQLELSEFDTEPRKPV